MLDAFVCFICCIFDLCTYICALPNCTVVLIVWTIGQVLVLCAAYLCLSDWLMCFYILCHFVNICLNKR